MQLPVAWLFREPSIVACVLATAGCWSSDQAPPPVKSTEDRWIFRDPDHTPPVLLFAHADMVVKGRVVAFEDKHVRVSAVPAAPQTSAYQVGELIIAEVLHGPKVERLRLGVLPDLADADGKVIQRGEDPAALRGKDALFFVRLHHTGQFHQTDKRSYFLLTGRDQDAELVKECQRLARLMADAKKSLQATDERDRLTTAAILLNRYRRSPDLIWKTEPIDAEESTLILDALASVSWAGRQADAETWLHPLQLFQMLELDGWVPPPKDAVQDLEEKAKRWIAENRKTYRITRFLRSEK